MYIKAKDMMHEPSFISADLTIREVADIMDEKSIGSVLVKDGEEVGILTERDIIKKVVSKGKDIDSVNANEIMSSPVESIDSEGDVFQVASIFSEKAIRRLAVTEDGEIVGILTTRDVTKSLIPGFFMNHPLFKEIKEFQKTG